MKFIDPDGMDPIRRVNTARSMVGTKYKQETDSKLRTESTTEALEYMDCAEFVCRVMAADNITNGVKHMASSNLKAFLDNTEQFIHSETTPEIGDIAVWNGHVGIVTGVDGTKIKLTHARGANRPAAENPYAIAPEKYRSNSTFYGYYRPINENYADGTNVKNGIELKSSNTKLSTTPPRTAASSSPTVNTSSLPEKIYEGGVLPEVIVKGQAPSNRAMLLNTPKSNVNINLPNK